MSEEPQSCTIQVRCVGRPPAERVVRASGVSDVSVDGTVLQCRVTGSVQPFLEALHGAEVLTLTTVAGDDPASDQPPADTIGPALTEGPDQCVPTSSTPASPAPCSSPRPPSP